MPERSALRPLVASVLILLWGCAGDGLTQAAPSDPAGAPASLAAVAGDEQEGLAGVRLPEALVVEVRDAEGRPVPEVRVQWEVRTGDGSVSASRTATNADGRARTRWALGPAEGVQAARASVDTIARAFTAVAEAAEPGRTYSGRRGYTQYTAGDLPVIISAPHGGLAQPDEIPDRGYGTFVRDRNTLELAYRMAEALEERTGGRAHVVALQLHRRKLDANRALDEAAQGNAQAEQAWHEYHDFIEVAKAAISEQFGGGLFIDLHGHGHDIQRLELGYLLQADDLARPDAELDESGYVDQSSIRTLAYAAEVPFSELIRGETSLGGLYEAAGYPAVPSYADPAPGDAPYFSGGYNTRRHGARDGGPMSGVQLEANWSGVRDDGHRRAAFAEATAEVLQRFFAEHYGIALTEAAGEAAD